MNYKDGFIHYVPTCEQEEKDKAAITQFIERNVDCLDRENLVAHITSSAIITNKKMDKVLFAHHNIFNSWAWVGGHNDGNPDLLVVALKEAKEETGIHTIEPYDSTIMMIDVIYVPFHTKKGVYVNDHLHMNATFLFIGDETESLFVKEDENSDVRWFKIDEVMDYITEERIKPVYKKAFDYIKKVKKS